MNLRFKIFDFKPKNDPPLIQALLADDLELIEKLRDQKNEPNRLNYSAVEIAQFLDKQEALDILVPDRPKKEIAVQGYGMVDTKKFENIFGVRYLSHLKFRDYSLFIKTVKRCPWIYKKTILGRKMRQMTEYFKFELSRGYVDRVEIQWVDDQLGYGLFAAADLEANTYIAEYTGEISQLDYRYGPENPYLLRYPKSLLSLHFLQVDAEKMGNETRFINHSYQPNLKTGIALDRGIFHSFFATRTPISKGTQLTFNYGRPYWKHMGEPMRI